MSSPLTWIAFALVAAALAALGFLYARWSRGRTELTQRVAELVTIQEMGRTISQAQFDVEQLCQILYDYTSRIADTSIFILGLFDGDDYDVKLWMQEGRREPVQAFHLTPGIGVVSWMRQTHQPLLIRDYQKELESLPARPALLAEQPPNSALFVPLMAGESVIGTLSAQSYQRAAYGESDVRVLMAIGNQAAVAIQKALLYDAERKRARQLETIGEVTRQVMATLELEELFRQTVRLIRENFGYYYVALFTGDAAEHTLTFRASASAGETEIRLAAEWGAGLIGWVADRQEAVVANNVEADRRYRRIDGLEETRSELVVPLRLEQELVGVLDVQSNRLNAFGPDDLFILETLSAQVAIAIQEARLYTREQQQAWLSTALLQVSDALGHLSDIDDVLTSIVRLTPMLSGVDACGVFLWDPQEDRFYASQSYGLPPSLREQFQAMAFPPGSVPALDLIRAEENPILIRSDSGMELVPAALREAFSLKTLVLSPLVAQGELLGVMAAGFGRQDHPVGEDMMSMLTGIANQAAMVIQSARLLEAQKEEAYVSQALLQVSNAVSHSKDMQEALSAVVRVTPMLVGVEACSLFLQDSSSGAYLPYQQFGLPKEAQPAFWQLRFAPDRPPVTLFTNGKTYVTKADAPELTEMASVLSQGELLILPVSLRGEVAGLMAVDCSAPLRRFTERRLSILSGIAGQVAVAVENDRLLRESAEQERLKQELEVAKQIQISFLPECCPEVPGWELSAIWRAAREVAGDFYDFIPISSPVESNGTEKRRMGLVVADVADKGVPAALYMALSRTLVRTMAFGMRTPAAAIGLANNLILADARSDLFLTLFYAVLDPDSGEIVFVNAGHPPALLVREGDGAVEQLRTGGMAMGILHDEVYEQRTAYMQPGDSLVLYTDGIVEAMNADRQMFTRQRLIDLVREHRTENANELADTINGAVAAFVGDAPTLDDLTLVVARRRKP